MLDFKKKDFVQTFVGEDEDPDDEEQTCFVCEYCEKAPIEACDVCNNAFEYGDEIYCNNEDHLCKKCYEKLESE